MTSSNKYLLVLLLLLACLLKQSAGEHTYTWGSNSHGQLGLDNGNTMGLPFRGFVQGMSIASLKFGTYHSGAVSKNGSLYTWGFNGFGQLGIGNSFNQHGPVVVSMAGKTVASLSLGGSSTGAVTTDGSLYMWGDNSVGQLGTGDSTPRFSPVLVSVAGKTVTLLSLSGSHTGAVTPDGVLYMWGYNDWGQLGTGDKMAQLRAVLVSVDGKVVVCLSLGGSQSGAVTADGSLYMWGYNHVGQLGTGDTAPRSTPVRVSVAGKAVALLSLGYVHTGAVTTDGSLYMWGDNGAGRLGTGDSILQRSSPTLVSVAGKAVALICLSYVHSGAITTDGALYMWGSNDHGQIHTAGSKVQDRPVIVSVAGKPVTSLSLGDLHSGAITKDINLIQKTKFKVQMAVPQVLQSTYPNVALMGSISLAIGAMAISIFSIFLNTRAPSATPSPEP